MTAWAGSAAASRKASEILPKAFRTDRDPLWIGRARVELARGRIVAADGTMTELRPKTAALLRALVRGSDEVRTKDELLDQVWPDTYVVEDALVQCIGEIRRALGTDKDAVRTHAKRGYSVRFSETPTPASSKVRPRTAVALLLAVLLTAAGIAAASHLWREPRVPGGPAAAAFLGPSVAVLPFESLTEGERWHRLARALTEDVVADLSQNAWLFVFADAATRSLGAATVEAARDVGADYVVTGSIQVEEATGRVNAALIEADTGRQVWAKRFEGAADDLLGLQRQASDAIVGEFGASWTGPIALVDKARARGRGVDDLAAYDLYLHAGDLMSTYTPENLANAEELLKRVVAMAPTFGEAWAKLSLLSYNRVHPEMSAEEMEALWEQGDAAALEAYRVAPDRPNALGQAANVVRSTDPEKAEGMIRRAAALAPNNADILAYLAFRAAHFPALGPEAEGWIERAIQLNPTRPDWYDWNRATVMMVVGDYAEAVHSYSRAPNHIEAQAGEIAALALSGNIDEARAQMQVLLDEAPHFSPGWFADAGGLHPDVAAVFERGFALAAAPADSARAAGGGRNR